MNLGLLIESGKWDGAELCSAPSGLGANLFDRVALVFELILIALLELTDHRGPQSVWRLEKLASLNSEQ